VVLMMRVAGAMLAIFGVLGFAGSFDVNAQGKRQLQLLPIFLLMLAAAAFLWIRANRQSSRNRRVTLDRKLLSLGQESGALTVAQVVAGLQLTSEEATAALTQLTRDGLAQFDVDAEGAPIYRVSKLPPPRI
jgi:hypothetical protein